MTALRAIGGVILGYVVIMIIVSLVFGVAFLVIKVEGSFRQGSWVVSPIWSGLDIVAGFVAAIIGGLVCTLIAVGRTAAKALAGLVLVLGLLIAVAEMMKEEPPARTGEVTMVDAMNNARKPLWNAFALPIIGATGVLIGAGLVKKKSAGE